MSRKNELDREPLLHNNSRHLSQAMAKIYPSYQNALLLMVPIGFMARIFCWVDEAVFLLNLVAIASLISWTTSSINELSASVSPWFDELVRASLGNALEIMLGAVALTRGQVRLTQSVLLGSILCYLLPVLGGHFYISGYNKRKPELDQTLTSIFPSALVAASFSLLIPTALAIFSSPGSPDATGGGVALVSHVTAIVLFLLFFPFLSLRLQTYRAPFSSVANDGSKQIPQASITQPWRFGLTLLVTTSCMILCSSFVVDSLSGFSKTANLTQGFTSLVVIPLMGNSMKYITILGTDRASRAHRSTLGIGAVVSSVLRITFFVLPCLTFLGWALGLPPFLAFDGFDAFALFLGTLVTTAMTIKGETSFFQGLILIALYLIAMLSFYLRSETLENITLL